MSTTDEEVDTKPPAKPPATIINTTPSSSKKEKLRAIIRQQQIIKEQQRLADEQLALLQQGIGDSDDDEDDDDNVEDGLYTNNDIITSIPINRNINSNITTTTFGMYEYTTIQHDDRLEVKLPWLEAGYAWTSLAPEYYDMSKKKKTALKTIPYDMFPEDKTITKEHAINYFKHVNDLVEPNETDINNTIEKITSLRELYKTYITEIIYKFWFDIATKIGITSITGQQIRDNKSLVKAFQLIDNKYDLHKIVLLLHIIFDWLVDYQQCIMELMEIKFPIKLLKVPKITNKRSRKHCMHLLITKVITLERKIINTNLSNTIGIKVYITREHQKENEIIVKNETRTRYCIYDWMIRGAFVSK